MLRFLSLLVVSLLLAVKVSNKGANAACSQNHVYFPIHNLYRIQIRYVTFNSHLSYILHDFVTKLLDLQKHSDTTLNILVH